MAMGHGSWVMGNVSGGVRSPEGFRNVDSCLRICYTFISSGANTPEPHFLSVQIESASSPRHKQIVSMAEAQTPDYRSIHPF